MTQRIKISNRLQNPLMQAALPSQRRGRQRRYFPPGAFLTAILIFSACVLMESSVAASVVDANNEFAVDLYQMLKSRPGNIFFSPYSISASLAMTYAGARGQTASEMAKVLHFGSLQMNVHTAFAQMNGRINAVQRHSGVTLLSANSLWLQKDYSFTRAFLKLIQKDYDAEAQTVDFANQPFVAQNEINSWVAEKTDGKIENLIAPGQLTQETRLVLCNAIYFKGKWQTQFNPADTKPAPFYITTNQAVTAPMMSHHGNFVIRRDEDDSVDLLAMPYIGGDLSMIILLPANEDGIEYRFNKKPQPALSTLEEKLTVRNLYSWLRELDATSPDEADISVPRFATTQSFDLSEQLISLGMVEAFNGGLANFSGMDGMTGLYISDVVHQAYIQVNEEGTEAAAYTAVNSTQGIPESFIVDRPFIFIIRDNATGAILFLGRIVDPTK